MEMVQWPDRNSLWVWHVCSKTETILPARTCRLLLQYVAVYFTLFSVAAWMVSTLLVIFKYTYTVPSVPVNSGMQYHKPTYFHSYILPNFLFYFSYLGFTACQDYFTHFEQSQSVGGAKTRDPREKQPDHPSASRTWLVSHVTRARLEPTAVRWRAI